MDQLDIIFTSRAHRPCPKLCTQRSALSQKLPKQEKVRHMIWRTLHSHQKLTRMDSPVSTSNFHLQSNLGRPLRSGPWRVDAEDLQRLCEGGQLQLALNTLSRMDEMGIVPSVQAYRSLLRACSKTKALAQAKHVHAHLAQHRLESKGYLGDYAVGTLVKCGGLEDALQVFGCLQHRTVSSWTAVISGYCMSGQGQQALRMYRWMLEDGVAPNSYTFVSLLKACASIADLEKGRLIHAETVRYMCDSDLFVRTSLVDMYAKCGSLEDAQTAFDGLPQRDLVCWNAMLAVYAQHGKPEKALQLYKEMKEGGVSPNDRTFVSVLQACGLNAEKEEAVFVNGILSKVKSLEHGRAVHCEARKKGFDSDVFVGSTLISVYGKCGSLADACTIFEGLSKRNVVSWNAMLVVYIQQGAAEKALQLYDQMLEEHVSPNDRTFVSVLQACGILAEKDSMMLYRGLTNLNPLGKGREVHAAAQRKGHVSNRYVCNTLFSMYLKCKSILDARNVFDALSYRSVVTWTVMLSAYVEQGRAQKAMQLYRQMQDEGVSPDDILVVSILQACSAGTLEVCRQIHQALVSSGKLSPPLVNSLIHAYGKCGSMEDAQILFDAVPQHNVVSWTALIAGYARQGQFADSLRCYRAMQVAGTKPDGVTFLCILSVCNHVGLVEEGLEYFESMSRDCGVVPEMGHYVTMVDLLGRAGYFTAVKHLLSTMPGRPDFVMWLCLLGACRKHGEVSLARCAFDAAVRLQAKHAAAYVLMWNTYADAGLWDCAQEVEELQHKAGALKVPGQAWTEYGQEVHSFTVGGSSQLPQEERLCDLLEHLSSTL